MSQRKTGTMNKEHASKILGIQFSILSPDEIRKGSVAAITSRDTYINNKPVINGLFDPRMGVLEPGFICPTDGLDYMQTPGYFGHIDLARPLFYIQYLNTVIKIARCTCVKCSKLLISKEKYKQALEMQPEARWNYVFSLASKVKRCGEDTSDGCGCKQPSKIKKEGLSTLIAEWEPMEGVTDEEQLKLNMTPEVLLKQFRRISDEDVSFMGFSPIWSRPDWMICQVLAVPPPAVRPSVKHDTQQRSEDDITHIIVDIIKANKTLQEKIATNARADVINDWTMLLQYRVATLVDNNIPGVAVAAQRSGRPLKSIKERLNGKHGRVRGNLMGKRVDFSARSVITPDPNLSIKELGVPKKIAMNITRPVLVNKRNIKFLQKLVRNGPDVHPGAKNLDRKRGETISLRYVDRETLVLEPGDVVHRHMMDGDAVLFNRQPTLHRMSMMSHIVRIMPVGDTFRMNVADTKPYNADFDGDEMNMHMPQDIEAASELRNLAAVPWQIISPASNSSIVGIFQDSLLGAYQFTRKDTAFSKRDAMNLLMSFKKVDVETLGKKSRISNFDLLSQIMPPLTLNYKTKTFKEGDDYKTSNGVLDIQNGVYHRGQLDKGVLGGGSKGLLQRICNDYGNMASADFIDDLQNIVTEYMKTSAFSVGISDLIADEATNKEISQVITTTKQKVHDLIDQAHIGIFENNTGKTNEEEFETQIKNITSKCENDTGKIGRESLSANNRFAIMVKAGSKGSDLNMMMMISCVGQQNVDGKRIPYGFEDRTLPHFNKFDDTPGARGFVESSYISGLSPEELFFHAMGGRVGLIDTAVKTSQTGYIQRRLIKGLEDLKVEYDMTVRNNKQKIIQYSYGEDGFDTTKVENQMLPLVSMTLDEIYAHYYIPVNSIQDKGFTSCYTKNVIRRIRTQKDKLALRCKEAINMMITMRERIVNHVFHKQDNKNVHLPVAFGYMIQNVQGEQNINANSIVDMTPLEAFQMIDEGFERIKSIHFVPPTDLFKTMYYYYLSPKEIVVLKRFNRNALKLLIDKIVLGYKNAIVAPGEMVGMIAAQSIGEPTTQMTLNTFHFAGVASKSNVTRGVPRIEEILSLSENPKNPSCTVHMFPDEEHDQENAEKIMHRLQYTPLRSVVDKVEICFDPDNLDTLIKADELLVKQYREFENMMEECMGMDASSEETKSKWVVRVKMNEEAMLDKNITMDDINFTIKRAYEDKVDCVFSDYNDDNLVFRLRVSSLKSPKDTPGPKPLDVSDEIHYLKTFQDQLLDNIILRGVKHIERVIPRKITNSVTETDGAYVKRESWVLDTVGTNLLDLLGLDFIDNTRTFTNDIQEVYRVLGIEAARQVIFNEISEVMEFDSTYINYHHLSILCDRMTCNDSMVSIFRHGINNDHIGPIAKASFEETPEMFLKAARHAELDPMRGVSANVMCGQEGFFGTNAFNVVLDTDKFSAIDVEEYDEETNEDIINAGFENIDVNDPCYTKNIEINTNIHNIKSSDTGADNNYDPGF
jgi:DNA-directed RNA polymerase II subunit RPB1